MQIKIDINSQANDTSPTITGNVASAQNAGNDQDAGAPNVDQSLSPGSTASAGTIDIGGPPQWLTEALQKESPGVSASGDQNQGEDAGAGPSFE